MPHFERTFTETDLAKEHKTKHKTKHYVCGDSWYSTKTKTNTKKVKEKEKEKKEVWSVRVVRSVRSV